MCVSVDRANNHHAFSVTPSYYLSNLLSPCFTPSCYQWLGQKAKRKVSYCLHFLATWFMLHTVPNKQCLDHPFISPKSLASINIRCRSFLGNFLTFLSAGEVCWTRLLFLRYNLLHICIDSHQGAACFTQSRFPVFGHCAAPLEQLEGCSCFKDTSAVDEWGESVSHLLFLARFSQTYCAFKVETFWISCFLFIYF